MKTQLVSAKNIKKSFFTGKIEVPAVRGVDFDLFEGEFATLVGPSGSGKTTLLNLIGGLDIPTEGSLTVLGQDLAKLTREQRAELRLRSLGFVFQAYNLVPVLTVRENVEFILELQGAGRERFEQAGQVLESLGLAELGKRFPKEISGGQQQRVAVARAIASKPKLVLADEPTANLDHANAETLMVLMRRLHDENGMTFLFSTHDPRVMKHATRVITLSDGRIEKESTQAS
jgi:putative ABC transport system ATP-binding protein